MAHQSSEEVLAELQRLKARLEEELQQPVPKDDPSLAVGSPLRRAVKRRQFRLLRPITRRYDRMGAELAGLAADLAERLVATQAELARLQLDRDQRPREDPGETPRISADPARQGEVIPDSYYWTFEQRQRGSQDEIAWRLLQYERLATDLRENMAEDRPLWLDIGCGRGELCKLLKEWGWMAWGVDMSVEAVEECRAAGIEATVADALGYLLDYQGPTPSGLSAIQLIEHLPKERWLTFFERARALLSGGGGLLVETINPLNVEALSGYFFADVSHTWPANPETLRLMAEHAGFAKTDILFVNPDHRGNPQDFALWAMAS